MARNGSGTYSIPNSFVADTTIASADVNENFSDIGTEITGSLPRDGQAGMTGQFKAASGTASAPGMAFSSSTGLGFRRSGGNEMKAVANQADVFQIDEDGITMESGTTLAAEAVTGTTGVFSDTVTADGALLPFPVGTVMLFVQTAAPTGWTKGTTHDDKALRVVTGTVTPGGTGAFSTRFAAGNAVTGTSEAIALTEAQLAAHRHFGVANDATGTGAAPTASNQLARQWDGGGNELSYQLRGSTSDATLARTSEVGSGSTHSHGPGSYVTSLAVAYVDVIIATKD